MILFRILYTINVLASLVVVYFFFIGLSDGSITSFNIVEWLVILTVDASILIGGWKLKSNGHLTRANLVLLIAALPALVCVAYFLIAITMDVRWN